MPGRFAPPERAAGAHGLAGDDLRHGDALVHGIGVHEPGHDLLVGAHVRRHDVDARADERDHFLHVPARQVLEFALAERARIDGDAALGAPVGQIGERAFPAHPDRQRPHLADVDVGREARAALGGPKGQVMLNPVAGEDPGMSVVHVDRAGDDDRALGEQQPVALVVGDREVVGDDIKLLARHLEHGTGIEAFHKGGFSG